MNNRDYYTKLSKSEKDKYHILLICGIKKKMFQMNLFIKQKQTHRQRKQIYGDQMGKGWGGMKWEFGINIYTPLYGGQQSPTVQHRELYSTSCNNL